MWHGFAMPNLAATQKWAGSAVIESSGGPLPLTPFHQPDSFQLDILFPPKRPATHRCTTFVYYSFRYFGDIQVETQRVVAGLNSACVAGCKPVPFVRFNARESVARRSRRPLFLFVKTFLVRPRPRLSRVDEISLTLLVVIAGCLDPAAAPMLPLDVQELLGAMLRHLISYRPSLLDTVGLRAPSAPILVARMVSTYVTVDPSSSNACVSTCPLGPIFRTSTIFRNAHDVDGFCVFHRASQYAFFIMAQSLRLCGAELLVA
ncbi:hypothetical protein EVAR_19494_1 [Eumeta japonica]|uniref:Uncharacterized protein n=1 Tax=Eumeta variegata TaxID=151549 RepID=A0A4C1V948_EUMVA|nr:hypothetical protein EVAR_19494_1 [Eumeta japonica]